MKLKFLYIVLILAPFASFAQNITENLEGSITFKSSKNIYVKFNSTEDIALGDTLFLLIDNIKSAALIVRQKSSTSCVTETLNDKTLNIGDIVFFIKKIKPKDTNIENKIEEKQSVINTPAITPDLVENDTIKTIARKEMISGRISLSTNADLFPDNGNSYQRLRTGFSFNIQNIRKSAFSMQSYLTYRHRYGIDQQETGFYDDFKIFTLALQYSPSEKININIGRKINPNIANIGAIDGFQGEFKIKKFGFGIFAGTRPDLTDFSINTKLPQFGGYIFRNDKIKNGIASTSLAIAEQMFDLKTDRRFLYFQHNNSLVKNLNIFLSSEIDLYEKIDSTPANKLSLTSIYFSARYRLLKNLSLSASYDNRRNIIYYESYQTFIDQLLAQETRQGFRFQTNYSPFRNISINASAFLRYQGNNSKPTTNYVCNLTFNKIPLHNISLSLTGNYLEAAYFNGIIVGGRISDNFLKGKLNAELNYRNVDYIFSNTESNLKQNIAGVNLSFNLLKRSSLTLSYEGTFDKNGTNYHRYYITINQRFKN